MLIRPRSGLLPLLAFNLLILGSAPGNGAELTDYRVNDLLISTCKVDLRYEALRMF